MFCKGRKQFLKKTAPIMAALFVLLSTTVCAENGNSYVYDENGKSVAEPLSYVSNGTITGEGLGIGDFNSPKDVFVFDNKLFYIVDTGNNRIVEIDADYKLKRVISAFNNNGTEDTFSSPNCVFRTDETIYIADTGNKRVVLLDDSLNAVAVYGKPESKLITEDFDYEPTDIVADSAGRMFIVSKSVNDGIIELTDSGEFVGFIGAVKANLTLFEKIWRAIASESQREKMQLALPTEHSSVDIDESGFVYTTVSAVNEENYSAETFISRLNPMGKDILKRNGFNAPMGDVELEYKGGEKLYSMLVDIAVRESGVYSVLDQRKGRIFTYDSNGELMYVFGALGDAKGQFGMPEALDTLNRDTFLVADSEYNWIALFEPTEYGLIINDAVDSFYNRDYDKADSLWKEAIKYTSQSSLAFDGLGRSYIKQGKYKESMDYLKNADDRENYSKAFESYRSEVLRDKFSIIIISVAVISAGIVAARLIIRRRRKAGREHGKNNT